MSASLGSAARETFRAKHNSDAMTLPPKPYGLTVRASRIRLECSQSMTVLSSDSKDADTHVTLFTALPYLGECAFRAGSQRRRLSHRAGARFQLKTSGSPLLRTLTDRLRANLSCWICQHNQRNRLFDESLENGEAPPFIGQICVEASGNRTPSN